MIVLYIVLLNISLIFVDGSLFHSKLQGTNFTNVIRNRHLPTTHGFFHPATSMEVGESRTFIISRKRYNPQPGRELCGLTSTTFEVRKIKGYDEMDIMYGSVEIFYFYALSGGTSFNEIPKGNETHKYHGQIGYIRCKHGWIDDLTVFEEILERYQGFGPRSNPRGCGIGVILTELCLIDPELNNMNDGNRARNRLQSFTDIKDLVVRTCDRLIALVMTARPIKGAHIYFSAAIRMGYGFMVVDESTSYKEKFMIYETEIARQNFDSETAVIQPCCGMNNACSAYGHTWYFCSENGRSLGPKPGRT